MADNIIKLRVDSSEYDSKIKRAAQGLQALGQNLRSAGKTFADADKDAVKFAQELGKMQTVSNTARGKISELSAAFVNLKSDYLKMTDAEKQSPIGQAMAKSLEQLKTRTLDAKRELESLNKELELTSSKASGGGSMNQLLGGVAGKFGMSSSMFTGVGAAVAGVGAAYKAISDNISTAMGFEKSMSQLSSLTGMVGKDLEQLKEYAIELGSTSTLTASQVADAFRLIGSQQPQLLASGEALKEVTKYAITLSEAAGIDLQTAAQTLSTSINQMGGDSNNAARYVNVLAAASQKGAGDIAWLGEAITKSATAAKAVGTDYEELVANLEQLAKAGFDASTAGTALRSIIMNLEKQANNDFKPSIVGLTQAFENLGKANLSIVEYQQIAGKMFASQAMALANAAQEAKNMTVAITGTNTATEQATTNTTNLDGSLKALASAWEGLNLHINSSNGLLKDAVDLLKDVVTWVDKAISGMDKFAKRRAELNNEGAGEGNTRIDRQINTLSNTADSRKASVYSQQIEKYWRYINEKQAELQKTQNTKDVWAWETIAKNNKINKLTQDIGAAQEMLKEYERRGKAIVQAVSSGASTGGKNGKATIDIDVDADTEEATKSIQDLQGEIKKLKKLRDDAANAGNTKLRDQYNAQIKDVQAQIKAMRGTGSTTNHNVTVVQIEGSIDAQTKKVQDLQKAWRAAADDDSRKKIKDQIEQAQTVLDVMNGKTKLTDITIKADTSEALEKLKGIEGVTIDPKTFTVTAETEDALLKLQKVQGVVIGDKQFEIKPIMPTDIMPFKINDPFKGLQTMQKKIQLDLKADQVKVDENTLKSLMKDAIQNGIDGMDFQFAILGDKIGKGIDIPDSAWQGIIDEYNALREQIGMEPITIDLKAGSINDAARDAKTATRDFSSAANAIAQMGSAMASIEDPTAKVMGIVAQAIATVAQAFASALASDTTTKGNVWAFIGAAAASVASMVTTIQAIHSATGYAEGGVVKGTTYSNDQIPAYLNAGETVLTRAQSGILSEILDGDGGSSQPAYVHVSGEQLLIPIFSTLKRKGQNRGEYIKIQ